MKKIAILLLVCCAASAQKGNRKLVWEENFNGKDVDEKTWNFELGGGGFGNHERQEYTKDNYDVSDGNLTITVKKDGSKYTSTRITTKGKKEFQYGYMEARAKLPTGYGIWPAFWMLGSNIGNVGWPKAGEIDIMEYIGREPHQVYTTIHDQSGHGGNAFSKKTEFPKIEDGFHLYAVEWDKDKITFYVDDKPVFTYKPEKKNDDNWPFSQPFFFILNVAVGGDFGGPDVDDKIFPQEYVVDYVKVYQ